jgi:hypothetical protein
MLIWLWKLIIVFVFLHSICICGCHNSNSVARSWLRVSVVGSWRFCINHSSLERIDHSFIVINCWWSLSTCCFVILAPERSIIQIAVWELVILPTRSQWLSTWRYLTAWICTLPLRIVCVLIHVLLIKALNLLRCKLTISLLHSAPDWSIVAVDLVWGLLVGVRLILLLHESRLESITLDTYIPYKLLFSIVTTHVQLPLVW